MRPIESIRSQLVSLDGKDYGGYQSLSGKYAYPGFSLFIDRIPKDPYAPPHTGVYRLKIPRTQVNYPAKSVSDPVHKIAAINYFAKWFFSCCSTHSPGIRGTGYSGLITISEPGQAILPRSSVSITMEELEVRFFIGMPARNRSIHSDLAQTLLFDELPEIVRLFVDRESAQLPDLESWIRVAEDAQSLRRQVERKHLVGFIANGSILPRESGVNDQPMDRERAVAFRSPPELEAEFNLPHAGVVTGMGVPEGVTLLVGGGYHGKTTLLNALEQGIYNHIPGDGRELCVSLSSAVKVRSYSGRSVVRTDISPFISSIPGGGDTSDFSSENASGSTSQAAFISESIEAGAKVLMMDEDTCATNFLVRDQRMQQLVRKEDEPITAYIDSVRQLYDEHGISTVMVVGGSGDYLDVADCVIQMKNYVPFDVTDKAKQVTKENPSMREHEGHASFILPANRKPLPENLEPRNEHGHWRIYSPDSRTLVYGKMKVDLSDMNQLLEPAQVKAIGMAVNHSRQFMDGIRSLEQVVSAIMERLNDEGIDLLDPDFTGDLVGFRSFEMTAVLNRMRDLRVLRG